MISVHQYWHDPVPPPEVSELIRSWGDDPELCHRLFDHDSATRFIDAHFGADELACWNSCAVPAMQADFFRLCVLYAEGGAYIDCDTLNLGGLPGLCQAASRGILFTRHGNVANDFMYFARACDRLLKFALDQAKQNIRAGTDNNVWRVTGPGIMTKLRNQGGSEWSQLMDGIELLDVTEIRKIVGFRWDLAYKDSSVHWTNFEGSIFNRVE